MSDSAAPTQTHASTLPEPLTDAAVADFDRLRDSVARIDLGAFRFVRFAGEDRKGWLQGQVTGELRSFTPGSAASFCLVAVTGQLQAICDGWALSDTLLVSTASETAPAVLDRAERMVVMEDVVAEPFEGLAIGFQGPDATRTLAEVLPLPTMDAAEVEVDGIPVTLLRSNRTGLGGWDVLLPGDAQKLSDCLEALAPLAAPEAVEAARLEAGIPRWGLDAHGKVMPPELGSAFDARHVSYTKGCYLGQEVLHRIHSRGHTNKTWMALMLDGPVAVGTPVTGVRRPDAGIVTSVVESPDFGWIAGAMMRNDAVLEGDRVEVGGVTAEVRSFPLLRFG